MAAEIKWRKNASPAYLRAPADACMMTGEPTSSAAIMMACTCSKLLTLKAGNP